MSFANPSMEMNLYRVEIVHEINLFKDGDLPIYSNQIDSPFMNPEIFPSTRVGRWETIPHLENYVELDTGQSYKIKLFNYTWKRCLAKVTINDKAAGHWKIEPRCQITVKRPLGDSLLGTNCFLFSKSGSESDLITVQFYPEQWTESNLTHLAEHESKTNTPLILDVTRETLMSLRLVPKRRYNPYPTVVGMRSECPSYINMPIIY